VYDQGYWTIVLVGTDRAFYDREVHLKPPNWRNMNRLQTVAHFAAFAMTEMTDRWMEFHYYMDKILDDGTYLIWMHIIG
jgi:hypothetical protein